jgi:hypothetical protein
MGENLPNLVTLTKSENSRNGEKAEAKKSENKMKKVCYKLIDFFPPPLSFPRLHSPSSHFEMEQLSTTKK